MAALSPLPHQSHVFLLSRGHWPPGCARLHLLWRLLWLWLPQLSPLPVPAVHILDREEEGAERIPSNTATVSGISAPLPHRLPQLHDIPPKSPHTQSLPALPLSLTRWRILGLGKQIPFFSGPCPTSSSTRMGYSSHFPLAISWGHMMLRKTEPRVLSDWP